MARPQIATDKQILDAAQKVLTLAGPDAFTLTAVADQLGLSRAAIILRFKSTQALKITLMTRLHEQFIAFVDTFPKSAGGDQLLEIAAAIGSRAGSRKGSSAYFAGYHSSLGDRAIADLEARRGAALREAVMRAMPQVAITRESAADAFMAHVTGSLINALSRSDMTIRALIVKRTTEWLRLAGIPYNEATAAELANGGVTARKKAASRPPEKSTRTTRKRAAA